MRTNRSVPLTLLGTLYCALLQGNWIFCAALVYMLAHAHPDWPAAAGCLLASLIALCFLNMANFFARLKQERPDLYWTETRGRSFLEHVGWADRTVLRTLHASVARIAVLDGDAVSRGLVRYARVTCWLNWLGFAYLMLLVLSVFAFAAYTSLSGRF